MKEKKKLLPQHFPNGQRFTEEQLQPLNNAQENLPGRAIGGMIGTAIITIGLALLFSNAIGGVIGNTLAAVVWILLPVGVLLSFSSAMKSVKNAYRQLGITDEEYKIASENLRNDTVADNNVPTVASAGGTAFTSQGFDAPVYYRFKCKKCGQVSEWRKYTLTASTQQQLETKKVDFTKLTEKKKKCFENKRGYLRYYLDRKCSHCGHMQTKGANPLFAILMTPIGLFCLLGFIFTVSMDPLLSSVFYLPFFLLMVAAYILYIVKRVTLVVPEYRFTKPDDYID